MFTRKISLAVLVGVIAFGFLACGGGGDDGPNFTNVKISWILVGTTCSNTDIETVKVDLFMDGERVLTRDSTCGAGSILIEDVETGSYEVRVQGIDADSNVLYEGTLPEFDVDSGDDPATPENPIQLKVKESTLQLRWSLPQEASNCAFAGIENVEINITQDGTGLSLFTGNFPCNLDPNAEDLPAPIVDGWIEISGIPGGTTVNVVIFGLDEAGLRTYVGDTQTEAPKSGAKQLNIPLEACNDNCV